MTLGQALQGLSREKKIGAYKIAQALGVYHSTVYDWWKDTYRPSVEHLAAYAALMGVPVDEITAQEEAGEHREAVAESVFAVLERVAGGEDPVTAFTTVTGQGLTASRRPAVRQAAMSFKKILADLAGIDWGKASPELRSRVLAELQEELLQER